jgi:short-subunit dehydrogenase
METTQNAGRKLAVVTGASSGIGYELAKIFAKNNFDLLVAAEDTGIADASNAFREIGVNVTTVQTNLATYEGVERLYTQIRLLGRPVDAIAINAGVGVGGKFIENNLEEELNLMQLNIVSVVHLAKRVINDMVGMGRGKVLITSSLAAEMPGPYYAVYAASKAFVQSFSEAIRNELDGTGVTVTALQPGATETNFFHRANMEDTPAGEAKKADPAEVALDGFHALMNGKDHVVSGVKNKIQAVVSKFVTDKQGAALQGKQTKPNSI